MSDSIVIESLRTLLDVRLDDFSQEKIKSEPMVFDCDSTTARHYGGPITENFLDALPKDWRRIPLVIDSRVHMLMPGWFPCIPGWHHDDVARTRSDKQPDYFNAPYRTKHIIALVGDCAPTMFATGRATFTIPAVGRTIYQDWHAEVENKIASGELETSFAPSQQLIEFDDRCWHRGTSANSSGWRFFIRATRHFDREGKTIRRPTWCRNESRQQVQVYLDPINMGW